MASDLAEHYAVRLVGEAFADAANRHDHDAFAALWLPDGVWDIGPPIGVTFTGREAIRGAIEELLGRWDFFVQMPHAFSCEIQGNRATASWTIHEMARTRDLVVGNTNVSLYLDDLARTGGIWRFKRRRYRTIYSDQTPLTGHSFHLTPDELSGVHHVP